MDNFKINSGLFPFTVWVFFCNKEKMFKKIKPYFGDNDMNNIVNLKYYLGKHIFIDSKSIIWMPSIPKYTNDFAILQHEIFHTVISVLDHVGLKLCDESEETYSYLVQHYTKQIYTKLGYL